MLTPMTFDCCFKKNKNISLTRLTGFFTLLSKCLLFFTTVITLTNKKINPTCVANAIPHIHRAIEQAGMMMKVSVPTVLTANRQVP